MTRELDTRTNAQGDRVTLLWCPAFDRVEIEVEDALGAVVQRAVVPPGSARDAFEHPYLYLPTTRELLAA